MKYFTQKNGFTLVETIFTIAIMGIVFTALFTLTLSIIKLNANTKASTGAISLANERMEYIRSLPYRQVGTIGAPPYGIIPQNSTTTLNGITYNERVFITYIDAAADGEGGLDSNGIMEDYKLVKLEYTWKGNSGLNSYSIISNIIPVGIESSVGGGTIRVNVFDDSASPVSGAEVHFFNDTLPTTTDTIRYTNNTGVALLSGAPEGANYEITVTKTNFSQDGTYTASSTNPNPTTQPVAVVESAVSTMNFIIATTSDLNIRTVSLPIEDSFFDTFTDASKLASTSNTNVTSGGLILAETAPNVYSLNGLARTATITPATLDSWYEIIVNATSSATTSYAVSLYYDDGGLTIVPDSDLSGNSSGFTGSYIDISSLDVAVYDNLILVVNLSTTDSNYTSEIYDWEVVYIESQTPIPNINFDLFGLKTIGTDASSQPVLKYNKNHSTDGSGDLFLTDMEYDVYDLNLNTGGYSIVESCEALPYSLSPGESANINLTMISSVANSLRVLVTEIDGTPIHGADVHLERGAVDETKTTSVCGQTFFNSGLATASDYELTVSKSGYTSYNDSAITIDSNTSTVTIILN
ncbi:prepilin-type N-terminal cleavage/methylation domain-containing protein [Candidatus Kaiserbacteria bacterium]|nr:prepilin-type N-terminal cleavage/methylation domain-containing protein [Candidatus Kaiserbacteria bacterium]